MVEWSLVTVERGNSQDRHACQKNVTPSLEFRVQLPLLKKLENLENRPLPTASQESLALL